MLKLSTILSKILEEGLKHWTNSLVVRSFLGLKFSLVRIDTGHIGVAYIPEEDREGIEPSKIGVKPTVKTLVKLADESMTARSLALAAISAATNAWLEHTPEPPVSIADKPLPEIINAKRGEKVLIAGYMRPLVDMFLKYGLRVIVAERSPTLRVQHDNRVLVINDIDAINYVKEVDHLIVSGSSLLYPALLAVLLREATNARTKALIGPTANIHPDIMRYLDINLIGGSHIPRSVSEIVERYVELGCGYHDFRKYVVKWYVWREA